MGRAPCCDKAKVKKGPWSVEEDALLMNFMANSGNGGNWLSLPKKAGLNRCGKSCRLRWLNYLRPNIKHGYFTEEEDDVIYTLYHTIGSRWSVIASYLQGRTDNDVKNHWNTKLKKKMLEQKFPKNNCVFPSSTTCNTSPVSHLSYWQNLSTGEMDSGLDQSHKVRVHSSYNENFTLGENNNHKYEQSISVSHEMMSSHSGSSSSVESDPNNSNSALKTADNGKEDEFWMDMLSESFENFIDDFRLEEKLSEIALLLDVSFDSSSSL